MLSHGGAVSGFVAQNTVIPSTRSAVVFLSNTDFSPIGAAESGTVAKVMPKSPDVPTVAGAPGARRGEKVPRRSSSEGRSTASTLGEDFSAFLRRTRSPPARGR